MTETGVMVRRKTPLDMVAGFEEESTQVVVLSDDRWNVYCGD